MTEILVVEDDVVMREFIARGLAARGHPASTARGGEDALRQLRTKPADIVITDIRMPGMDGFSFARALRREAALGQPDIIFVSSMDERDHYRRAMHVGGSDFLVKPFRPQDMADAVERCIATREERKKHTPGVAVADAGGAQRIPGYEIVQKLGEGAASIVYLATHLASREQHALKVLKLEGLDTSTQEAINRFMAEYDMLSKLSHPHVAHVYEHGVGDRCLYIGMEHLPGGDLRLDIEAGMSPALAQKRAGEIASALAAIHAAGIVHRDLKPANILMRMTGEAVIADFGIAKQLGSALALTRHDMAVGTPYYMSPEQARGSNVGPHSDTYALGVLYFEMLTGHRPFEGGTPNELMGKHLNAPIPLLPTRLAKLQPLIDKLMAKSISDRYANAEAAREAIMAVTQ
ncbi:MAG: protein kinase [Burkholderiales bacterium]|nr:protein kinase [Burkholderiales bacterium]